MASAPSQEVLKVPAAIRTLKEHLESAVKREPKLKQAYYRLRLARGPHPKQTALVEEITGSLVRELYS